MIFPVEGSIINIQAYKYDGTLYRQWNGVKVLRNTAKHYVLLIHKTKVSEQLEHNWVYRDYVLWFMPKYSMFNALILLKPSRQNYSYINVASHPIYEDNTIKFIDFDLDIKAYPATDVSIVDSDEFKQNSKLYNYPQILKKMIVDATQEVVNKYEKQEYFFNSDIIDYYIALAKKDKSISKNFRESKHKKYYNL
ncbi:DUF402 domain-containing protein [Mycoplasmopsis primatum]|uniref:DUF402 domain-containing protein n=1 Tax=Mycoplasmopsis primatum TaxID=55604 RepID=UPI000495EF6E